MITPETLSLMEAAQQGDNDACTRLLEENAGLIWSIVRRYNRQAIETEDLYQLACLGFLKAVRGFDPSYGTQFSTYAVPKIAGEIRRFLRDDGIVKVGRGMKERAFAIRIAREKLLERLNREPTLSELSAETGLTPEDIAAADLAGASVSSIQSEAGDTGLTLENVLGYDGPEESLVEKVSLRTAIARLPPRQQKIILLRYYKGMTQDVTARILGISQVQVSRLERKSILFLRNELSEGS